MMSIIHSLLSQYRVFWGYSDKISARFLFYRLLYLIKMFELHPSMQTVLPHENHVEGFFLAHTQSQKSSVLTSFCLIIMAGMLTSSSLQATCAFTSLLFQVVNRDALMILNHLDLISSSQLRKHLTKH